MVIEWHGTVAERLDLGLVQELAIRDFFAPVPV